jgi:hypothetical protein
MNRVLYLVGHTLLLAMTAANGGVISGVIVELFSGPSDSRNLDYVPSLRSLSTLNDLEFNRIAFVQALVSIAHYCRVMDKYIWTVIASDETVPLGVVEPFDLAPHLAPPQSRRGNRHDKLGRANAKRGKFLQVSNLNPYIIDIRPIHRIKIVKPNPIVINCDGAV